MPDTPGRVREGGTERRGAGRIGAALFFSPDVEDVPLLLLPNRPLPPKAPPIFFTFGT